MTSKSIVRLFPKNSQYFAVFGKSMCAYFGACHLHYSLLERNEEI